jgi:2-amino-4-hydroxy-6-hydroxymethyldihydropteridine diphosphokinase
VSEDILARVLDAVLAHRAVLSLGANLGDPDATLASAVRSLRDDPASELLAVSSVYATDPVGGPEQPEYRNVVVLLRTARDPDDLLRHVHGIEQEHHRERNERWGPRTLDIDIVDVDGTTSEDERLTLPHPRAHERAFVLVPWAEVDPGAVLVGRGPVLDLAASTLDQGIRRLGPLEDS